MRVLERQPKTAAFFLELERKSRDKKVLASKLLRYGQLFYSGRYAELFATRALRLLVVFDSPSDKALEHRIAQSVLEA